MDMEGNIQTQAGWPQICSLDHCAKLPPMESKPVLERPLASFDTENRFSQILYIL